MDGRGWERTRITLKAAEMLAFYDSQWIGEDKVLAVLSDKGEPLST